MGDAIPPSIQTTFIMCNPDVTGPRLFASGMTGMSGSHIFGTDTDPIIPETILITITFVP